MIQTFLPKIHRMRQRIRRQLARQRQLLEDAASQLSDPDENWGAPGEKQDEGTPRPSMYHQQEMKDHGGEFGLPECPAHLIECPALPGHAENDLVPPPTSHFQHVEQCNGHERTAGHQCHGTSPQSQEEPGPMPGVRPPLGGAGGIVPPPQAKGSGAMGIIMPLYTVGIVVFFVYTIMKVLFKKGQEDDTTPKLKDFGLDPEYRKYVFAEEYLDNSDVSSKEQMRRQAREESKNRKKAQTEVSPDTKIGEEGLLDQGKMDTQGKKLGEWYLPEGFLEQEDDSDDDELLIGGTTVEDSARETIRDRVTCNNKGNKGKKKPRQKFVYEDIHCDDDIQTIVNMKRSGMESQTRQPNATAKQYSVDSTFDDFDEEEAFVDEDYLYSDEFLGILRKGLRNFDPEWTLEGDALENLYKLAHDHLREKHMQNCVQQEAKECQKDPQDLSFEKKPEEEDLSGGLLDYPDDTRPKGRGMSTNPNWKSLQSDGLGMPRDSVQSEFSDGCAKDRLEDFMESRSEDAFLLSKNPFKGSMVVEGPNNDALQELVCDVSVHTTEEQEGKTECEKKDEQLDQLRRRLEETEKAMERLMCQMGSVTDKLTAAKITEVLSQAQAQAKILKEEVGEMTSEEDLTSSEALTTTMSEDTSLPTSLQRHLEEIQKNEKSPTASKGSSPDMDQFEVITKDEDHAKTAATKEKDPEGEAIIAKSDPKKSETSTQKADVKTEVEKEAEDEEGEEAEDEEEEVVVKDVPKEGNEPKRQSAEVVETKPMPKKEMITEEELSDEEE